MRHRTGAAALAVLGGLLVVVAVFTPSWWAGPIHIAGRVIHGKTVHISMMRTTGCNSGDGTCMGLDVGAGFRVVGILTLLLATATAAVSMLLAWKSWRRSLDATGFARLALIGTAATVIGAAFFIALVPERFADIPAGFSPYAFFAGTASIALASVLALRRFAPSQEAAEPVDVRELLSTDGLRPAMLGPEPKMSRYGAVHEPPSFTATTGPRFRPLYEVQAEQAQREALAQQAAQQAAQAAQRAAMGPSGAYPPMGPSGAYPPISPTGNYAPVPPSGAYPPVPGPPPPSGPYAPAPPNGPYPAPAGHGPPSGGFAPTGNYPPMAPTGGYPPMAPPGGAYAPAVALPSSGAYPRAGNYDANGGMLPPAPLASAASMEASSSEPALLGGPLDDLAEASGDEGEDGPRREEAELHVLSTGTLRALSRADSAIEPPGPGSATSSAMLLATADQLARDLGPDEPDEAGRDQGLTQGLDDGLDDGLGDGLSSAADVVSTANLHPVTDHSKALAASDSASWRVEPPEVAAAPPSGRAESDPGFDSPTTPSQMSMAAMLAQQASEAAAAAGETSVELAGSRRQATELSEMSADVLDDAPGEEPVDRSLDGSLDRSLDGSLDASLDSALDAALDGAEAAADGSASHTTVELGRDTRAGANDSGVFLSRKSTTPVSRASRPPTATTSASLAALAALSKPAVITMAPSAARKGARSAEIPAAAPVAAAGAVGPVSHATPPAGVTSSGVAHAGVAAAAPAGAPSGAAASPACPQCEAPMAWAEKHHRYYCGDCRMYF